MNAPINLIIEIKGGALYAVRILDNEPDTPDIYVTLRDHDDIEAGDPDPLENVNDDRLIAIY